MASGLHSWNRKDILITVSDQDAHDLDIACILDSTSLEEFGVKCQSPGTHLVFTLTDYGLKYTNKR